MKVAISAKGNELSSQVDPRFGRAVYFIVYDTEDDSFEAISNGDNVAAKCRWSRSRLGGFRQYGSKSLYSP